MPAHARTLLAHFLRLSSPAAPDAALLTRWLDRRDEAAFTELVARHGPMVLGVCRRVLGDAQHAEDAFQATFLVLARKAASLRRPESLPGFLYGVALRLAKKARGLARRRLTQAYPASAEPADPQPHPLDALSGRELLALLDEEVARLPEAYRLPVLLCLLQERPVEEAARLLGWGVGSVRGRLARGKDRLRERLARRGLCLSAGTVTLLTPLAVPERLLAASLRNLAAPASAAVHALAAASAPWLMRRAICMGLLLAAVILGAGLPFLRTPDPETRPATAPFAQAKVEPLRDRSGDPLPAGAIARLGTIRFRTPGEIDGLTFAPDGKTLAASSRAGLFLFNAASGKRLKRLPKSEGQRGSDKLLVFSPDGRRLACTWRIEVGDASKEVVRVWELAGGREPRDYDAENVAWLGWSAEGEPLAVCLEPGALRLRELATGKSRRFECKDVRTPPQRYRSGACACTVSGRTLAFVALVDEKDRPVHVWDTTTGRRRCVLEPKEAPHCASVAVSPDGSQIVTSTGQAVKMWDVVKGELLYTRNVKDHDSPRFSADGKLLVLMDALSAICVWDAATGRELSRTRDGAPFGFIFDISADGKTLATTDQSSGVVHLFDAATGGRKPEPVGHLFRPRDAAFSPDGRRVATGDELGRAVRVWDLATGASLIRIERPREWVRGLAYSADGRSLYCAWTDEVWVCDAETGRKRHSLKTDDPGRPDMDLSPHNMRPSADSNRLFVFSHSDNRDNRPRRSMDMLMTCWETGSQKPLFHRRLNLWFYGPVLSRDGCVLAVPYAENNGERESNAGKGPMRLEDAATVERLLTFPSLEGETWPQAFSPDGRLLAAGNSVGKRHTLRLWETATAAEVLTMLTAGTHGPAFSADGRLLAVAAPSQEILVWDLARGRAMHRFKGFDAQVTLLAFSPDGRKLVSGLDDSTLLVWDVGTRGSSPATKLGAEGVAKAWADLTGADAARAFRARWALANSPAEAVALLKDRLRRAQPADAERLRRLLADLNNDQFAVRTKAQSELEELGDLAEPALRKLLADNPTLEVRRRVQKMLENMRGPVARPELLRPLRAVAVLEDIGTPAARELLRKLAAGAPEVRLTREAAASLGRLNQRTARRDGEPVPPRNGFRGIGLQPIFPGDWLQTYPTIRK